MAFPKKARFVVIGAGIHGLSTAWHLAEKLKKKNGNGTNNDIVVIDKGGIASGASGIACGVVRNNYFQPAMRELMMHSVKIWESDPKTFSYHPVGYMQISPESMRKDVTSIYEQQKAIGYESEFIEGKEDCTKYMKNIFYDWQAKGITSGYIPLGAVLISDKLIAQISKDSSMLYHGFTYSGHPVSCAAALKNIEIMKRDKILEHVREITPYFHQKLNKLYEIPIVGDVRGMGLMAGIECVIDKDSKNPLVLDKAIASRIDEESLKLGLIIRPIYHICVLSPALIIQKNQIDELVDKLFQAIANATAQLEAEGLWTK